MFIITLGDVFGLIMLAGVVVFAIGAFFFSKHYNREDKEPKKDPEAKKPKPKKQVPWYLTLAGIIAFITICLLFAK